MSNQAEVEKNQLTQRISQLKNDLDFFELETKYQFLEKQLLEPNFWENTLRASQLNQEFAQTKELYEQINNLDKELENLSIAILVKDEDSINLISSKIQQEIEFLEQKKFLQQKFDTSNVTMSIHAGAGGLDAQDWASMLSSMYQSFFEQMGWRYKITNLSSGDEGGVKSITFQVNQSQTNPKNSLQIYIYGLLKEEIGVHRLVRLSPFNSGHTRETSFALVEILPQGLDKEIEIKLEEKDLRWDYFMASGKGGQSVNTTYSAVRVVHNPTNISTTCQNERSQLQNKQIALEHLKNKLAAIELQKKEEFKRELKGQFQSIEWGSQIRSYVLHPYKMIKDHRSNWQTQDVCSVLEKGNLLDLIWSVKKSSK